MSIVLGGPEIVVEPPAIPSFEAAQPAVPDVPVVAVPGAPGPAGPAGPAGPTTVIDGDEAIATHVNDPTPHPAYDEGPDLLLLYQNAKV